MLLPLLLELLYQNAGRKKNGRLFGHPVLYCYLIPYGCATPISRGNLESYVHFMESYVHFMRIAIAKALESTRGLLKNFKECT